MKFRRQNRLPARLAHDWVRFVIRRDSSHLQPFRDRSGPSSSATLEFRASCSCHSERSEESAVRSTGARTVGYFRSLKRYWVYILASTSHTLYTGVTNDLMRRVHEHKTGTGSQFTGKYRIRRLVLCEETNNVRVAIAREKQIKGWDRAKKVALIEASNPCWDDLAAHWYETADSSPRSE